MKIESLMSAKPITINSHQTLKFALNTMRENNIRHLPVLENGKVRGVLSERDIRFLESVERVDLNDLKVADAYSDDLFSVEPHADVKVVCQLMHDEKIGSVVVQREQDLLGIFTWIDALK
ncbi:CBS domain-containing protein, partial [Bacteriovorax sp. DB6_IX]|uniref:CBS domain-containing protein n=1 Tax=Bacteriovorax sp. DB6_IX TaxID=1353530 RepID=UPI000389E8FD